MSFRDLVRESLRALEANRGRSFLTILGIVIGIAAVIAMTSFIGGVQELELGSFWESYAALGAYFEQQMESPTVPLEGAYLREPEQYLGTEDYDFDGHWDLYIPDTMQGECVGNYYRFSPETGRFEQWDELNAIGFEMYTDPENGTLNAYTGGEFRRWEWQDGGLVLTDEASR